MRTIFAVVKVLHPLPGALLPALLLLLLVGCVEPASDGGREQLVGEVDGESNELIGPRGNRFPEAPAVGDGPLPARARRGIERIITALEAGEGVDLEAVRETGAAGDPRVLWLLTDLYRFARIWEIDEIEALFTELTGAVPPSRYINHVPDHLIAWDLPAYPGYREDKRRVFMLIEPRWEPFFDDPDSEIDWRMVSWGGVLIDDRLDGSPGVSCFRCIPALDDPPVTDASRGGWYPDSFPVFGVVVNGEARAYPKHQMEVHEMVNDTLGGRRIGIPYCTLCHSAQAYYLDNVPGFEPILRTSGLLSRSNKFTYDRSTYSAIDTFTGKAISGPLHEAGVVLEAVSVITSTWGEWKAAHPETTILARDGGVPGRSYPFDPLGGRDDNGPIFPVGAVDQRLPTQELVLGVISDDGGAVAFPVANATVALREGERVTYQDIELRLEGSGLRAFVAGRDAGAHEAFWFAWSQFRPDTEVWRRR